MRHINKTKLLIILFTPLVLWFLYFLIVDIYDTTFNHYRITNFISRVEDKINRKFAKPKSAKVFCDNCGVKEIYLDYPYEPGYHIDGSNIFHCIWKGESKGYSINCYKLESADKTTFTIISQNFAHDKNNIYCQNKAVNHYEGQNIKVQSSHGDFIGEDFMAEDDDYFYRVDDDNCKTKKEPSTTK